MALEKEILDIAIVGAGGHGLSTLALIKSDSKAEYNVLGFIDDTLEVGTEIFDGLEVLGAISNCDKYLPISTFLALGIGGPWPLKARAEIFNLLSGLGFSFPTLIHKSASIDLGVEIASGVQVHSNSVVRIGSIIGKNVLINTGVLVEHGCEIGNHSSLATGSILCGNVKVGSKTFVGAGAVVIQNISIGNEVLVGASTLVRKDVESNSQVIGVPGRKR